MSRTTGIPQLVEAVRAYIWSRRSLELASIGLKVCAKGEWQIPAADVISSILPQVVVQFTAADFTPEKPRKALQGGHTLTLQFLRLLGDTELKNDLVVSQAAMIADLFAQSDFRLPEWTLAASTGVVPSRCWPSRLELQEGFLLGDDLAEVEQVTITLTLEADSYIVP